MNGSFLRLASGACAVVMALLPMSLSAQVIVLPSASAVQADGQGRTSSQPWHYRRMPPSSLSVLYWGWLTPFAGLAASGLAARPAFDGPATLNRGGVPANTDLMAGSGNGNGNGNSGSNNGNGNLGSNNGNGNRGSNNGNGNFTNGNGNFGFGDGVGNGNASTQDY